MGPRGCARPEPRPSHPNLTLGAQELRAPYLNLTESASRASLSSRIWVILLMCKLYPNILEVAKEWWFGEGVLQAVRVWTGLKLAGWGFSDTHLRPVWRWGVGGQQWSLPKLLPRHFSTEFSFKPGCRG